MKEVEYIQRKKGLYRKSYDLEGEVFGHIKVISKSDAPYISPGGKYHTRWNCVCLLCGREKTATSNNLCKNNSTSCVCQSYTEEIIRRRSDPLIKNTAGFTEIFGSYKRNASKRGYCFELSDKKCQELFQSNCFYCNEPPSCTHKKTAIPYTYNGIDRIDSNIGYIEENTVSCCKTCNRMKMALPFNEFTEKIKQIYRHLLEKDNETFI